MINEEIPKYFSEFIVHIDEKFDTLEENLNKKIESEINSLAISTANGFREMDRRFEEVDKRFNEIDGRLDSMDVRFDGIDKRLDSMDARFNGIDKRLDSMDARFNGIDKRLDSMDVRFDGIDRKLDSIDLRFDGIDKRLDIEFDGINNRLDRLESDVVDIKDSIGKIEGHIGRYEVRAQNIEQILLQDHKPRITELEKRVFN